MSDETIPQRMLELEREVAELKRQLQQEKEKSISSPFTPPRDPFSPLPKSKCKKCGIELNTIMGYCCPHPDCPTGLGPTIC